MSKLECVITGALVGLIVAMITICSIYKSYRPEVLKWRKLPEAPTVFVPETIWWKGAYYDCVQTGQTLKKSNLVRNRIRSITHD